MRGFYKNIFGFSAILVLSACASAMFPEFDDSFEEIEVHEGGHVAYEMNDEDSALRSDTENVAYENEDNETGDKVDAAKSIPVKTEDVDYEPQDEEVEQEEVKQEEAVEESVIAETSEEYVPSVSYKAGTIYFDNGSSVVATKYRDNIRKIAKLVKENNAVVTVYGHSSSRTRNTDPVSHKLANFKASMERAQNVALALKRAGVPADKISIEAMSDSAPAYQEVMPEGERLNRRAEIYIAY
ncbi:MAG: OmpA family protein [Alphaproteobacteria bacterium]|nr:OmpA family protein [Alphaproteobacteria bacterium]